MENIWVVNRKRSKNLGDKLIGEVITSRLRKCGVDIKNCEYTGRRNISSIDLFYKALSKIGLSPVSAVLCVLSYIPLLLRDKVDTVFIGGGQLLLPNRSFLFALLGWTILSEMLNFRCILFSVGTEEVGGKFPHISRTVLRWCTRHADSIYLRDAYSQELLRRVTGNRYEVIPDAAYVMEKSTQEKEKKNTYICAAMFEGQKDKYRKYTDRSEYWNSFVKKINKHISKNEDIFLFSSDPGDYEELEKMQSFMSKIFVGRSIEIIEIKSTNSLVESLSSARVVISSRMHPLIVTHIMNGTPVVIPSNKKIISFRDNILKQKPKNLQKKVEYKLKKSISLTDC